MASSKNSAVVVQEQLKQIGIETELDLLDTGTMLQAVYGDFDFDMVVTGDSSYVDPNSLIYRNFKTGESSNFSQYSDPEMDKLIDDGIATTDFGSRTEIYQEISKKLMVDLPSGSACISDNSTRR